MNKKALLLTTGLALSNMAMPLYTLNFYEQRQTPCRIESSTDSKARARYEAGLLGGIWSTFNTCSALSLGIYVHRINKKRFKEN